MLTRAGLSILVAGLALLVAGVFAGNAYYATLSLVPVGILLAGLALEGPRGVRATLTVTPPQPREGGDARVEVAYEVDAGAGAVELHVPLPPAFRLKEGENVFLVAKPPLTRVSGRFSFTVEAARRGAHLVGPLRAVLVHGAGVRAPRKATLAPAVATDVRPDAPPVRRMRALPGLAKQLFPESDAAFAGARTNDFRELREYAPGDSMRSVNWRATARLASFHAGASMPLVNEYEHEGKKSVWLFLDAAAYMKVGTTLDNGFEHAVRAASGIAQFYLERGYRLGAYVYNHDRAAFLHPDTGRKQLLRWRRAVVALDAGAHPEEGFQAAVERAHRFLLHERPLVVVVTRIGKADEGFFAGLRKLRGVTGRRRRRLPVLVLSPVVHAATPESADYAQDVVALLRRKERPLVRRARRAGARVIEWDPRRSRLETVLLHGGGPR